MELTDKKEIALIELYRELDGNVNQLSTAFLAEWVINGRETIEQLFNADLLKTEKMQKKINEPFEIHAENYKGYEVFISVKLNKKEN